MRSIYSLKLLVLAGLLAAGLEAAPIAITEPPDLPGGNLSQIFVLGVGTNTVSGNVSGCPNCGGDFEDNVTLVLPAGLKYVSGSLSLDYVAGQGSNPHGACFTVFGCFFTGAFSGLGQNVFAGTGQFNFTASSPYATLATEMPGSSSYVLTFNVAADVPEPATALLVIPVLAGLALVEGRRRTTIERTR